MENQDRYEQLKQLIIKYYAYKRKAHESDISEETIRTWLNEFLYIFGWNVQDTNQVLQEKVVDDSKKSRLEDIDSTHTKPDYTLVNGKETKTYLDAKKLSVDIFNDKEAAFQVRSYGWSANVPCAFLSNFEQFVVFDCQNAPDKNMNADVGAIQLRVDEYLDNFKVIDERLYKYSVYANQLERLYHVKPLEGKKTVDIYFNEILSDFRIILANNMYENNKSIINDEELLNYYVQIILDRIIFIRVCESRGIEKKGLLKDYELIGFWKCFRESCYMQFYNHYDGAMFARDELFKQIELSDDIFTKFINQLYYPFPYKFDAIPVNVIAKVYEEFLSYFLVIKNNKITVELKEEYVKTNGAVPTRDFVVKSICNETIDLSRISTKEELFELKILDPCCGSGIFLVDTFELIAQKLKEILIIEQNKELLVDIEGEKYLSVEAKRLIMKNCLYAIDYDSVAVEVTKMSLALKIIEDSNIIALEDLGIFGEKILREIHKNIVCGNTLVGTDIEIENREIQYIKPLDIKKCFKEVFKNKNGFDYIVGNPPYVETKFFKAASTKMHLYLRDKYSVFEGKADLAVLFIERCINLLNTNGRVGFIIQRRWFKTSYGKGIRNLISSGQYLYKLYDVKTNDLFEGRLTYVSILVLDKNKNKNVNYNIIPGTVIDVRNFMENTHIDMKIPIEYFSEENWCPEYYEMDEIRKKYVKKWGKLGDNKKIHIRTGIQVLWKKVYHITQCKEDTTFVYGKNGFGDEVKLEKGICRPIIYNRVFSPLKKLKPDAYAIFPYAGEGNAEALSIDAIQKEYPLTYRYLKENETRIRTKRRCNEGEYWHTYTRVQNHKWFDSKKIIVPMTAKDTFATFEGDNGLYMDNSNVWFLNLDDANDVVMKALTMIINSTIFSVFAKCGANPQSGGYYKFNKQFLDPVPIPNEKLTNDNEKIIKLSKLYGEVSDLQMQYDNANVQQKVYIKRIIDKKWSDVDEICFHLYEVEKKDADEILKVGRTIDRVTGESGESDD